MFLTQDFNYIHLQIPLKILASIQVTNTNTIYSVFITVSVYLLFTTLVLKNYHPSLVPDCLAYVP